jgi:drug/metabolite transporter (DMT)-like permease
MEDFASIKPLYFHHVFTRLLKGLLFIRRTFALKFFNVNKPKALPVFLLIVLAIIWGSSFILMKLGLYTSDGGELFSSWQVGALRLVFAGLILAPVAFINRKKVSRRQLGFIALVGLIGNGIPAYMFTLAETQIESAYAGVLNGLVPFFTLLFGVAFFRIKLKMIQFIGVALGLGGATGLLLLQSNGESLNLIYAMFAVIATVCYSLSVNIIHSKLSEVHPFTIASIALLFAGIPSAIFLFSTDFTERLESTPGAWEGVGYIAILGVFGTAFALVLFNRLIQMTSGVFASMVTYLIPIVAVTWGWLYGENLRWEMLVFGVLILLGIYLANQKRK